MKWCLTGFSAGPRSPLRSSSFECVLACRVSSAVLSYWPCILFAKNISVQVVLWSPVFHLFVVFIGHQNFSSYFALELQNSSLDFGANTSLYLFIPC